MIKPTRLKHGDTIGVIAPASPTTKINIKKAYEKLIKMGFKVKISNMDDLNYGYLAGTDELRAKELNNMFANKEVDGIICLRGGYGTMRILDLLDYELIKENPKIFVGYSDITALHIAFSQLSDLITFHGPMIASDMIDNFNIFSKNSLYNSIYNNKFEPILKNPSDEPIININSGIAEGNIIGGNLSLITSTLGTDYEINTKGKLLFIEEIGEEPYKIDRMFTQLILSNKFQEAEGIILGDFNNCIPEKSEYNNSFTIDELINTMIKPLNKPIIYNLQSGHCEPMLTIPFGVNAKIDSYKGELIILESPNQ